MMTRWFRTRCQLTSVPYTAGEAVFVNGPVSFQDGADGMLTPPLWSASPVSFQDSDAGSSEMISGERRDQPTTEAMSDKNDANDW
jgi:hypothetical protein